ncbi:small conductance mechanosensitive channel [Lactobacillus colini]|uniref:Small conductance mechanosensitive channel n=1 Tax=Lactobacillus colini TaxID=1819254 RepID=A0ABS4MGX6_9LACO|nr:mechanosensitive ion channel domain-containing protein [Lactobacillus colini]MBP2058579.1 small conductance mechanosensitive channel [Lactobacillus colini]
MSNISSTLLKNIQKKKTQAIDINWDDIVHNLVSKSFQLIILSIVFFIIWRVGQRIIDNYILKNPRYSKKIYGRKRTISELVFNSFKYTILFFYLYELLSILGLPVGTLLASAGILSLALGMGAQGFVSDLVTGLTILSEGQYDVGDTVSINNYTGTVIGLGLRTTRLKDSNNTIIYIPNREITIVENITRGGIGFNIDLQVASDTDLKKVNQAIDIANHSLKNKFIHQIKKGPTIIGLIEQNSDSLTYRIHFQIFSASYEAAIKNAYFSAYIKELQKTEIKLS